MRSRIRIRIRIKVKRQIRVRIIAKSRIRSDSEVHKESDPSPHQCDADQQQWQYRYVVWMCNASGGGEGGVRIRIVRWRIARKNFLAGDSWVKLFCRVHRVGLPSRKLYCQKYGIDGMYGSLVFTILTVSANSATVLGLILASFQRHGKIWFWRAPDDAVLKKVPYWICQSSYKYL